MKIVFLNCEATPFKIETDDKYDPDDGKTLSLQCAVASVRVIQLPRRISDQS